MDLSRSRSRRVKITFAVNWPQENNGGHLLAPNAARELDDGQVVSVGKDTTVRIWKNEQNYKTYYCHVDSVNDIDVCKFPSHSTLLATAGSDSRVCILDLSRNSSAALCSHTEHTDVVKRARFTIDNHVISTGLDGKIVLWDLSRKQTIMNHTVDTGFFSVGTPSSASRCILGCMKGALYSLDSREPASGVRVYQPHSHVGTVRDITFIDDTVFATGGSDGVVRLWDLRNPRNSYKQHCHLHKEPIFSLAVKDNYILSASRDGQVLLTDPQSTQTATVIRMNYPIFHVSWNASSQRVTVCSTKPDIELFELATTSSELDEDVVASHFQTPVSASYNVNTTDNSAITSASPSKVELILENEAERLVHIEGRKYGRINYRELAHEDKVSEKFWSTSVVSPRVRDAEFFIGAGSSLSATASQVLSGSKEGFVAARLLSDKRHALAMRANGKIELWNIIEMKVVDGPHKNAHSMKEAVHMCGTYAYGASWCRIDCTWGALRITLSHDEAFNAQANAWEYQYLSSIDGIKDKLSIYRFSVEDRRKMERNIINIGEEMLRMLYRSKVEVYVVQTKQAGSEPSSSSYAPPMRTHFTDAPDGKIPTWALTCLSSGPSARSTPHASSVNVSLEPLDMGSKLKTISLAVSKTHSVADLCSEVVTRNGMQCEQDRSDELIEFVSIVDPSAATEKNDEDDENESDNDDSHACGSSREVGETASACQTNRERIVDPLMMVVTAFYTYKERGSGTLRLKYRVRNARVRVDDL